MARSRGRKTDKIANKAKVKSTVTVVTRNVNDNHSDVKTRSRKRHIDSEQTVSKHKRTRSRRDTSDEYESSGIDGVNDLNTVCFEENNNLIELSVTKNDDKSEFPSEAEESSSDESEEEEGEIADNKDKDNEGQESEPEQIEREASPRKVTRKVIRRSRPSVEDKVDELSSTVKAMQEIMREKGLLEEFEKSQNKRKKKSTKEKRSHHHRSSKDNNACESEEENSDTMIYQEAVKADELECQETDPEISLKLNSKRESTSSEDQIDTSDEILDVDNFIADCARNAATNRSRNDLEDYNPRAEQEARRSYSQGDQNIRQSEASKARMTATPGNN